MKIFQLRRWLVDSGCADEWYVCVNGDVDPTLYQLEAIERIAEEFRGVDVQVMHGSRRSIDGVTKWMRLEQKTVAKTSFNSSESDLLSKPSTVSPKFTPKDWLIHLGVGVLVTFIVYSLLSDPTLAGYAWFFVLSWAYLAGFDASAKRIKESFFDGNTNPNTILIVGVFGFIIWTLLFFKGCESDRIKARRDVYRLQEYRQNY
ncbi:hypothetical protein N9C66_10255 [Akkermansiaceae bacterium]|nr:hypothetical protein [Akkermansiaceae bacterium]